MVPIKKRSGPIHLISTGKNILGAPRCYFQVLKGLVSGITKHMGYY